MNQDILKRYDNVTWGQKDEKEDKRGLKDEKIKKWWNYDAWLNIDNYGCSASMDNPLCDTATIMLGYWIESMDFWQCPTNNELNNFSPSWICSSRDVHPQQRCDKSSQKL